ncbi:hypothetical protein GCM10011490_00400 [Pseudoclavibacter endophyticus]|nr:hypothetical protein GCM10011490_00400 [Pseudoclavibacter endophyticus]
MLLGSGERFKVPLMNSALIPSNLGVVEPPVTLLSMSAAPIYGETSSLSTRAVAVISPMNSANYSEVGVREPARQLQPVAESTIDTDVKCPRAGEDAQGRRRDR